MVRETASQNLMKHASLNMVVYFNTALSIWFYIDIE